MVKLLVLVLLTSLTRASHLTATRITHSLDSMKVVEGAPVLLDCRMGERWERCYWRKNGRLVHLDPARYEEDHCHCVKYPLICWAIHSNKYCLTHCRPYAPLVS